MRKYLIFIVPLLFVVGIDNLDLFKQAFHTYVANGMYNMKDYINAEKKYREIEDMGTAENKNRLIYNRADALYKLKDYLWSLRLYQSIDTTDPETNFRTYHNMWNNYYRIGEWVMGTGKVIPWSQSLENYSKALKIKEDKETRENYEFVKKKLQELLQEEEQEKQKRQSNGNGSGSTNSNSGSNSQNSGSPQAGNWKNSGNYNGIWEGDQWGQELSENEKRELEEYSRQLQEFQKDRSRYMRNGESSNPYTDRMQELFGNDPQFQNLFPSNNGEKDW